VSAIAVSATPARAARATASPGSRRASAALAAFRDAGVPAPAVIDAPGLASRHRARLMVRGRTRTPKIGLFQEGSHRIADVPQCRIHHPLINRVAGAVRSAARDAGIEPYADRPHRGALRAIQVVIERRSSSAQLVLIENAARHRARSPRSPTRSRERWATRCTASGGTANPERSNAILGRAWQHLSGPDAIVEDVADCEIVFPPGAFGQSHPVIADRIARDVQRCVPDGARVVEFHAGCGPLGIGPCAVRRA
jgi:23S rRNA (uracil1939-C5)-methyltransferase